MFIFDDNDILFFFFSLFIFTENVGHRLASNLTNGFSNEDFSKHHVQLSALQRTILAAGSAAVSLVDPFRGDMIACLGETTGKYSLNYCLEKMKLSDEGQKILLEQPRINTSTIDMTSLENLPDGTLGKTYHNFLKINVRGIILLNK